MRNVLRLLCAQLAVLAAVFALAGCETPADATAAGGQRHNPVLPDADNVAVLRPGDNLVVSLQGIPDPSSNQLQIDDQGLISLPYIGAVKASGETAAMLARRIREDYVAKKIYNTVDVSVTATERYVYVGGEVMRPGRVVWAPDLTVTKAVQSAGGYAIYAKQTRVSLARGGKSYAIDATLAEKDPAEDPRMLPGDLLNVPKSAF
jgi:polysaccharide export outer membrane protein